MTRYPRLTIGVISARTAVNIDTIRYYERIGILPKPPRSAGGHRLYGNEHKQRLVFIRRARELGFSLSQVRELLALKGGRRITCAKVKTITEQHIADVRQRLKELKHLESVLSDLIAQCPGSDVPDCPILHALALGARSPFGRSGGFL
jgi:MerR family mercuric resistance operon transcriptional regulator